MSGYQNNFPQQGNNYNQQNYYPQYASNTGSQPSSPYASQNTGTQQAGGYASFSFPSVPSTDPKKYSHQQTQFTGSSYASLIPGDRPTHPIPQAPSQTPAYASFNSAKSVSCEPNAPSAYQTNSDPPSAYSSSYYNTPPSSNYGNQNIPSYISGLPDVPKQPVQPKTTQIDNAVPAYASFKRLDSQNVPTAYGSGNSQYSNYSSSENVEEKSMNALYQSLGARKAYVYEEIVQPVFVRADSLRSSLGPEIQVKKNEDGSTEGWLWQQRDTGHWDRLYFILDTDKLLGFRHYPQSGSDASPIQGLPLKPGMVVTPKFSASYIGVRGFCFAIQVQPKSESLVVFDTISNADREIWVEALEEATKANEVTAWMPWTMEGKAEKLQKQQELKQIQQEEEMRLRRETENQVQQQLEALKQQELAKVTDTQLASQLAHEYENERNLQEIEENTRRLRHETQELTEYKQQVEETPHFQMNQSEDIDNSIRERELELKRLEEEKARKIQEQQVNSQAEELRKLKEQQAAFLKQEEERIRAEMEARFEIERAKLQKQQEELLKKEKEELQQQMEEKKAKVLQWLVDNPSWKAYYKGIGVTDEELSDPRVVQKLIKNTAQYVIESGVENPQIEPTSTNSDNISLEEESKLYETEQQNTEEILMDNSVSYEESNNNSIVSEIQVEPDFSNLVPHRAPPPPPEDDTPLDITEEESITTDEEIPPIPSTPAPPIPESSNNNIPPPPSIPPPPLPNSASSSKLSIPKKSSSENASSSNTSSKPENMMNQIQNFQFKEKPNNPPVPPPAIKSTDSRGDLLSEITTFKFKERKAVPTIKQLPKQNQDSLTAILSDQLSLFRSKLREDQLGDEEDDDDYWD